MLLFLLGRQILAQNYEITFLGIPVVYVRLEKSEINHDNHLSFQYKAETTSLFSKIFLVRNNYFLKMDEDLKGILTFEKKILQKNLKQHLITEYRKDSILYSNGEQRPVNGRVHNMLSLIVALTKEKEDVPLMYLLEIEGEFFDATVLPVFKDGEVIRWEIRTEKKGGWPVLKETDLFTSRLGDPSAFRSITVDISKQMIVEAHFSISRYKLSAKLVDEKP